jgi:hypothetical protein
VDRTSGAHAGLDLTGIPPERVGARQPPRQQVYGAAGVHLPISGARKARGSRHPCVWGSFVSEVGLELRWQRCLGIRHSAFCLVTSTLPFPHLLRSCTESALSAGVW